MKTQATIEQMEDAVSTLISTRDFCGDEAEALRSWQADNVKLTTEEIVSVHRMVSSVWENQQRAAGVESPLNTDERRKAYRDIESGR